MKNILKRKITALTLFTLTVMPMLVAGQGETRLDNPITSNTLQELVDRVLNIIIAFAIPLYGLMIGIAGFMFITGAGTPEKRKKAANIVKYATIGFIILLLGKAAVALVRSLL